MRKIKRIYLLSLILFAVVMTAHAEPCVVVELTDNTRAEYLLSDSPKISFSGSVVTLTTASTTIEMSVASVRKVYVAEASPSGISETSARSLVQIAITEGGLSFSGLEAGSSVSAATINGMLVGSGCADGNGRLSLPLSAPGRGAIVVKTSKQTFKLIRK
jgi:hypothetical protein